MTSKIWISQVLGEETEETVLKIGLATVDGRGSGGLLSFDHPNTVFAIFIHFLFIDAIEMQWNAVYLRISIPMHGPHTNGGFQSHGGTPS